MHGLREEDQIRVQELEVSPSYTILARVTALHYSTTLYFRNHATSTNTNAAKKSPTRTVKIATNYARKSKVWCLGLLQRLQDTLRRDEDEIKRRLGESSRRTTVLRINESVLKRRYSSLNDMENTLRKVRRYISILTRLSK